MSSVIPLRACSKASGIRRRVRLLWWSVAPSIGRCSSGALAGPPPTRGSATRGSGAPCGSLEALLQRLREFKTPSLSWHRNFLASEGKGTNGRVPHSRALPSRAFFRAREREREAWWKVPPPPSSLPCCRDRRKELEGRPPFPPPWRKKDRRRTTTWGLRREEKRRRRRPPCRPAMDKGRKRKISEENRVFNDTWTESFAFTTDETGLPVCLICSEKFANNKKSNIARHFQNKHTAFAEKYPDGDERRKAVAELMRKVDRSKNNFKKWVKSANSTTYASVLAAQEIVKHGKPFTDGEYIKEAFIQISEHLYVDFKNKNDIVQKIKDMPLSVCEQVFSNMNYIKNKYRSRLTDDSLQACVKMKVTSYSPDVQTLCTEVQEQKSH